MVPKVMNATCAVSGSRFSDLAWAPPLPNLRGRGPWSNRPLFCVWWLGLKFLRL